MKMNDLNKIKEIYEGGGGILSSGLKNRRTGQKIVLMIF